MTLPAENPKPNKENVKKRQIEAPKFLQLYRGFSPKEKLEFEEFLDIKFINKGRNYRKIISDIVKQASAKERQPLGRSNWNRMNEMKNLAESFLILKRITNNKSTADSFLWEELFDRRLLSLFEREFPLCNKFLRSGGDTVNRLKKHFDICCIRLKVLSSIGNVREYDKLHTQLSHQSYCIYFVQMLHFLIDDWKLRITKLKKDKTLHHYFSTLDFERALEASKTSYPECLPLLKFNYHLYNSLIEPVDRSHYRKARDILFNELKGSDSREKQELYQNLLNSAILAVNMNFDHANEELLSVMKKKLESNLVEDFKNKYEMGNLFRDYVLASVKAGDYEWADHFIRNYKKFLHKDIRQSTVNLCKAFVLQYSERFAECILLIDSFKRRNPFHSIDARRLLLICLYETGDLDRCHSELLSLREFLRRSPTVQDLILRNIKSFCRHYSQLIRCRNNPDIEKLRSLSAEVHKKTSHGVDKWIKQKTEEMVECWGGTEGLRNPKRRFPRML